jgi:hypothetical protein
MKLLSYYTGSTLELVQPAYLKDNLELRAGETVLGKISFPKIFSSNAEVEFDEKKWEIKRESVWRSILGIYKYRYEMPSYKFVPIKTTLGEIQFPKGEYLYVKQYFFKSIVEVMDKRMNLLVRVKTRSGLKNKYLIELLKAHKLLDEYPWVLFLISYIIIRKNKSKQSAVGA